MTSAEVIERVRWKFSGTAPAPVIMIGGRVEWVKSYHWHRVDEHGQRIDNSVHYWHVDLFWRGLSSRPPGESVPRDLIWNWKDLTYGI